MVGPPACTVNYFLQLLETHLSIIPSADLTWGFPSVLSRSRFLVPSLPHLVWMGPILPWELGGLVSWDAVPSPPQPSPVVDGGWLLNGRKEKRVCQSAGDPKSLHSEGSWAVLNGVGLQTNKNIYGRVVEQLEL